MNTYIVTYAMSRQVIGHARYVADSASDAIRQCKQDHPFMLGCIRIRFIPKNSDISFTDLFAGNFPL